MCIRFVLVLTNLATTFLVSSAFLFDVRHWTPNRRLQHFRTWESVYWFPLGMTMNQSELVFSLVRLLKPSDRATPRLVLASQSPRRREILDLMGLGGLYSVEPSPLDEASLQQQLQSLSAIEYTRRLAEGKAFALAQSYVNTKSYDSSFEILIVLGSDTVVELDGCILEKPKDRTESKDMVKKLSGQSHRVHTGVAIYKVVDKEISLSTSFTETASVTFATLSDDDIDAYVKSEEGLDKAGAYGIQGIGGQLVSHIEGDFFTIMGLPMHKTSVALAYAIRSLRTG